jgi:hypothetical protein
MLLHAFDVWSTKLACVRKRLQDKESRHLNDGDGLYFLAQTLYTCAVMLSGLLVALSLHPLFQQGIPCGNLVDAKTEPLRSTKGYEVVLQMHSEDDHGKNTHLCRSEFTISGIRPDGELIESETVLTADGAWGRPISFGLQGPTLDGYRVIATISDGGGYAPLDIIVYDLRTGRIELSEIPGSFLRGLGSTCAAELHVAGTTPNGFVALATDLMSKCPKAQGWWRVRPRLVVKGVKSPSTPRALREGSTIEPLEPKMIF